MRPDGLPTTPHWPEHAEIIPTEDATEVSVRRLGAGAPLVIVHGALSTADDWWETARLLATEYQVSVINRRGRHPTGIPGQHNIDIEVADLAALLDQLPEPAHVLGHSYGAVLALRTALTVPMKTLLLYDPPLPVGGPIHPDALDRTDRLLTGGDLDMAMRVAFGDVLELPAADVDAFVSSPLGGRQSQMLRSFIQELRAVNALAPDLGVYSALPPPVLLVGEASLPAVIHRAVAELARNIPGAAHHAARAGARRSP